ncbi:MAG: tetratricopeptide repeat protein [Syntrophaceae bacterium]|nr:tetratricopeptide repeat protein [Syntrophaceae bacterium]
MPDKINISRKQSILVVLLLIVLILCVYWPVQNYDFINFDDPTYIAENSQVQTGFTADGLRWAFSTNYFGLWNPMVWLSFMLDFHLFRFNAGGYHWTNVIIHIFNAILLFLLFRHLTGAIWRSAFVAALFAIHPINVESVAWISERKNVLSMFFWMTTMLCYVWYAKQPGWKRYVPVLISFALGLMSKPMLVTLPFVLLLIDYWPLNRTAIGKQHKVVSHVTAGLAKKRLKFLILEKIPLFLLSIISIWITLYFPHTASALRVEQTIDSVFSQRVINAIFSYGMYVKKIFWPTDLFIPYLYLHISIWQILLFSVLLVIITVFVCKYFKKYPYLPVGWFWYLGTLVPVIGLIQIGEQTMADRYAYVTVIGLFIMIAWGVEQLSVKKDIYKKILIMISLLSIGFLAVAAHHQQKQWQNSFTLFENTLEKDPNNYVAYVLIGQELAKNGKNEQALYYYDMGLKLTPKVYAAYKNKAIILNRLGNRHEAIRVLKKAIQEIQAPAEAYYVLGLLYLEDNNLDKCEEYSLKSVRKNPNYGDAYNLLGLVLLKKGNLEESMQNFEKALRINPDNIKVQKNLKIAKALRKNLNQK